MKKRKGNESDISINISNIKLPKIAIIFLLFILSLIITLSYFELNNDFWFLINTGKYILSNGIPIIEPFTIHENLTFIAQQWLTDVIFYYIYSNFGVLGMLFLMSILNFIITLLIYNTCIIISHKKVKFSLIITLLVSVLLNIFSITTRPQVFDIILLLGELYLLELYISKNNKLYLIGLPIISLLMINLHSSIWLMLFVFLLPYIVERIIKIKCFEYENYSIIPLLITGIIMFIVGFINPYGIDSIIYLFNSYGVDWINNLVNEMEPLVINTFSGIIIFIYILFILYSYYYNKGNKIKLRYLLLFLGTCYLALSHIRGILFLLITSFLPIINNFCLLFENEDKYENFFINNKYNICVIAMVVISMSLYIFITLNMNLEDVHKNHLHDVVDYLDELSNGEGKIYTGYDDGGYLQYRGYKTYLDPRAEVFLKSNNKKEDILEEYVKLQEGEIYYKDFLKKYNFDYLLVRNTDILYNYIKKEDGYLYYLEKSIADRYSDNKYSYRIYARISK